jgi:hypothetical protein
MPKRCLLRPCRLLVLTVTCYTASAADIPPQLTLSEALNIALANSTVLREAIAQLDQTWGRHLPSRSALLPKLGMFARQSVQTISLQGRGIEKQGDLHMHLADFLPPGTSKQNLFMPIRLHGQGRLS